MVKMYCYKTISVIVSLVFMCGNPASLAGVSPGSVESDSVRCSAMKVKCPLRIVPRH
jgi:hypothetical protein